MASENAPTSPVVKLSTRAIANLVLLFFLSCFICLGYIVLRYNDYTSDASDAGYTYIVTEHEKYVPPTTEQLYKAKIINVEDVELRPGNSNRINSTVQGETEAEKLW
jgi:hypothetical protein